MGRNFLCPFKSSWNTEFHSFVVHLHPLWDLCIFSLKWSFHLQFHLFSSSSSSVAFTWNAHLFVLPKTSLLLHLIFTLTHLARPFLPSSILTSVALLHINNFYSSCSRSVNEFSESGIFISSWADSVVLPHVELPFQCSFNLWKDLKFIYMYFI